jgi:hypothetical protein
MLYKKLLITILLALTLYASTATYAIATPVNAGTLHGYCAGILQCIDNGTNSPTTNSPPIDFGFTSSGGPVTGYLQIDLLIPNNEFQNSSYSISGTLSGLATLFSGTAWTTGQLDTYLGINASPTNPFGAFATGLSYDPGATGFNVYQVNLGSITLNSPSSPNIAPLFNISGGPLPAGTYIVGFLTTENHIAATANSGAILDPPNSPSVPEPLILIMLGMGLIAFSYSQRNTINS